MKPILLPPIEVLQKPKYGNPCNGCGLCCHMEVCSIGRLAFETDIAPCPGIVYGAGRAWCALVLSESTLGGPQLIAEALGVGKGCCASIEALESRDE
jgi:hypothetical protein